MADAWPGRDQRVGRGFLPSNPFLLRVTSSWEYLHTTKKKHGFALVSLILPIYSPAYCFNGSTPADRTTTKPIVCDVLSPEV